MASIQIGHLLRASNTGFVAGCSVAQLEVPALGMLVRASLGDGYQVYGLITDIHIEDDGLVRQLVTAGDISLEVMRDNRERRIVPVEMAVLAVGYELDGIIFHLLPPRPPLSLDALFLATDAELEKFTGAGRFGYFRHVLRDQNIPTGEVLAAHILDVKRRTKNNQWVEQAIQELIALLRDDYPTLMAVLGVLGEVIS